jgi:HEAT repeat protein
MISRASGILIVAALLPLLTGCGESGTPVIARGKPVAHWLSELKSPSAKARKQAVFSLGLVGVKDAAAVPAVIGALRDTDVEVRRTAALALLNIGPAANEAVPALEQAGNDPDAKVRSYARKAVEHIRGR